MPIQLYQNDKKKIRNEVIPSSGQSSESLQREGQRKVALQVKPLPKNPSSISRTHMEGKNWQQEVLFLNFACVPWSVYTHIIQAQIPSTLSTHHPHMYDAQTLYTHHTHTTYKHYTYGHIHTYTMHIHTYHTPTI